MKEREYQRRDMLRCAAASVLVTVIAVLQAIAGRGWLVALAILVASLFIVAGFISWALAWKADPEEEAKPDKVNAFGFWAPLACAACGLVSVLYALVEGRPLDAISWLLASATLLVIFSEVYLRRKLTTVPVRPGPPQEWL